MILLGIIASNTFALSLGDTVDTTRPNLGMAIPAGSNMQLSARSYDHSEYEITEQNVTYKALVNNSGQVYGFTWDNNSPNLSTMLGGDVSKYTAEFNKAYKNRPIGDHRSLSIDTDTLSFSQFGLPGTSFSGSVTAKDLAPAQQ